MNETRLIRRSRFKAYHHYHRPEWSEAENRRNFGDQVDSHSHDWLVELELVGPIGEETGFSMDLRVVENGLADQVRHPARLVSVGVWESDVLGAVHPA